MKRWKKGVGEMIGYTIAILFLTIFYFIIMNALILNNAENVMEECVMNIGRQVVTCESLKDAQDRVQDVAEYYRSIKATVTFAPGYKKDQRKWEKGRFIQVSVTADVHGFTQWFQKPKTVRAIYMIENGGSSS